MRAAVPFVLAIGLAASLAACTPAAESPEATETKSPAADCVSGGSASEAVTVSGDFGAKPEVTFEAPLSVEETERTVVTEGDGDVLEEGDTANIMFSMINGETGEPVDTSTFDLQTSQTVALDGSFLPGIDKTLLCSPVGSRVVGVLPPADLWGDTGAQQLGVTGEQSLVFVVDIVPAEPLPTPSAWTENVPEVDFSGDVPAVTLPATDPPTELQLAVLEEGDGAVVEDGQQVTLNYTGISWNTGEVFDSSWERGEPTTFATNQVIKGFAAGLVGQQVGSRVIVVMPPELGYGTDPNQNLGGQTLVFLIEIQDAK
ncbi:FKBP-type peptidyl-prolyl cis-trans isomerase [Diaminobutyricimonas sp. TR449]|uniref:FKBP-type peptidyl-prolyl cis-trans isomerase n=1 Tax=Diaminobutyricimonas sp. TR449 TaxID=2708076 RepID=UPI0014248F35|nr:FKBP-type peptidyl-prolyl cis-trans isomerase [Diaminobutyricimonas sp. TR449]